MPGTLRAAREAELAALQAAWAARLAAAREAGSADAWASASAWAEAARAAASAAGDAASASAWAERAASASEWAANLAAWEARAAQEPQCLPPCHIQTIEVGKGAEASRFIQDRCVCPRSPQPPPTALVTTQAHPATSFWQQSWFLVGAGVLGGFFAVKLLKKSRTTKNPPGERGRLLEQIDEAISRRDSRKVGSIVEMLRFKYGLKHGQIFDMFKKAHPGLSMAQFDALLEESEE
jgi:hypothetical protein